MLQAALVLQRSWTSRQTELQMILQDWQRLSEELEAEEGLAAKCGEAKNKVLEDMKKALKDSEAAHRKADQAAQQLKDAETWGEETAQAEEDVRAARSCAREKDQLLTKQLGIVGPLVDDFPEVAMHPSMRNMGYSLPKELFKVWKGCIKLNSFDSHKLHGHGRHPVYKVEATGQVFAIKEYTIDTKSSASLRACAREAALLVRVTHDHIAEIKAVFTDGNKFYLQMPWYQQGTLLDWVEKEEPPPDSIRRALSQVLRALCHLHKLGVVHCDVKPENIFINEGGVAYLGDMDVSIDTNTRRSTVFQATVRRATKQQGGYTPDFAAPELLSDGGKGASEETDMYAFGVTMREVLLNENVMPTDNPIRQMAEQLAQRLTAVEPKQRPSAHQALRDDLFKPYMEDVPEERSGCCICRDQKPLEKGAICLHSHYTCALCLQHHVAAFLDTVDRSDETLRQHRDRGGNIPCPACLIDSSQEVMTYNDEQLLCIEDRRVKDRYEAAKSAAKEAVIWQQCQSEFEEKVRRVRAEFQAQFDEVLQGQQRELRLRAEEAEAATLADQLRREFPTARQCPRCERGPVVIDGCWTLATHHGDSNARGFVIDNRCPWCKEFTEDQRTWPRWDGRIHA